MDETAFAGSTAENEDGTHVAESKSPSVVSASDVHQARVAIGDRVVRTPLWDSPQLSEIVGARVLLKAELLQLTGAFKVRGVLNKLASLSQEERARGVITVSAGNHALALAHGARLAGIDALVVMWPGTSAMKRAAVIAQGATVDIEAADPTDAHVRLQQLTEESGRVLVHPFDDPLVIAGQGTLGLEILEDCPDTTIVLAPVGGGGLVSGIAAALSETLVRVVAVEPEHSAAMHEALSAGKVVNVVPQTAADGLASPFAGRNTLATCQAHGVASVLISEAQLLAGMQFLYGSAKLAAEPAGAAAVAALLSRSLSFRPEDTVVVVVSGGNVDPEVAMRMLSASPNEPGRAAT